MTNEENKETKSKDESEKTSDFYERLAREFTTPSFFGDKIKGQVPTMVNPPQPPPDKDTEEKK
ncbi:MAG: hypothetical protein ACO1G9_12960 [Bacteroidota bacterium]